MQPPYCTILLLVVMFYRLASYVRIAPLLIGLLMHITKVVYTCIPSHIMYLYVHTYITGAPPRFYD